MSQQNLYVGLDVSLETTSMCVVDEGGAIIWRGECPSDPVAICAALAKYAPGAVRVGLETGQLSNWLTLSLRRRGVPILCLDARHAKAALSMQINKTDTNDAFGLAQIVRTGWYREVAVKSMDAQNLRMLLMARYQLVDQRQTIANTIRGLLKTYGITIRHGSACAPFAPRVREQIDGNTALVAIIDPLLAAWQALREQVEVLDRQMVARAKDDPGVSASLSPLPTPP
jgi:transposase